MYGPSLFSFASRMEDILRKDNTKKRREQERIDRQAELAWERDHPEWYEPSEDSDGEYEEVQGECSDDD